jgi:cytochrome c
MFIARRNKDRAASTMTHAACAVVFAYGVSSAAPGAADSAASGKLLFNNSCRTCHSIDSGDNRLGPHLAGIVGRRAGSAEGYRYSSALKSAEFSWTPEKLDAFLADPDAVVPGNNMKPFTGIPDADERRTLIAYLSKSQ